MGSSGNDYEALIDSVTDAADIDSILTTMEAILCPRWVDFHSEYITYIYIYIYITYWQNKTICQIIHS